MLCTREFQCVWNYFGLYFVRLCCTNGESICMTYEPVCTSKRHCLYPRPAAARREARRRRPAVTCVRAIPTLLSGAFNLRP